MSEKLAQLLEHMTSLERTEVEDFAAFVLVRRNLKEPQILTDDIAGQELLELIAQAGAFDWLAAEEEDVYSPGDGEEVQWPA